MSIKNVYDNNGHIVYQVVDDSDFSVEKPSENNTGHSRGYWTPITDKCMFVLAGALMIIPPLSVPLLQSMGVSFSSEDGSALLLIFKAFLITLIVAVIAGIVIVWPIHSMEVEIDKGKKLEKCKGISCSGIFMVWSAFAFGGSYLADTVGIFIWKLGILRSEYYLNVVGGIASGIICAVLMFGVLLLITKMLNVIADKLNKKYHRI